MPEYAQPETPPYELQPLLDKSVIVTGGTTGIGRAIARLLATRGARVLIFGRHERELQEALDEFSHTSPDVRGLVADVSRLEDIRKVFRQADEELGKLDILVNNAAVDGEGFETESPESISYAVSTNVAGYLICAREAVVRMKKRGSGHIVNIGSMSASLREPDASTYVATKAAIQGFSESLRKTVNQDGIKVTLIEPGKVATEMTDMQVEAKHQAQSHLEMLKPEDIAACVYFCLTQPPRCDVVSLEVRPHLQII